jgi:hypothetical protein
MGPIITASLNCYCALWRRYVPALHLRQMTRHSIGDTVGALEDCHMCDDGRLRLRLSVALTPPPPPRSTLMVNPTHADTIFLTATCLASQGQFTEAVRRYNFLLAVSPTHLGCVRVGSDRVTTLLVAANSFKCTVSLVVWSVKAQSN